MIDGVRITNNRQGNHVEELSLSQANNGNEITRLFLKDLIPNELNKDARNILNNTYIIPKVNSDLYDNDISEEEIIFEQKDMAKICNW